MDTKKCCGCGEMKELSLFSKKRSSKDGYKSMCKECVKAVSKKYYEENKEKIIAYQSEYAKKNPERVAGYKRKWDNENPNYKSEYYQKNKERLDELHRQYSSNNRDSLNAAAAKRQRQKILSDPAFKINARVSTSIYQDLKNRGLSKSSKSWQDLVGYSLEELRNHLEAKFSPEMNWENYGSFWHVDHIIPKSWFDYTDANSDAFRECWSLKNLQPMKAKDNISKGNRYAGDSESPKGLYDMSNK